MGLIEPLLDAGYAELQKSPIIIHAEAWWYEKILEGHFDFFQKLAERADASNVKTYMINVEHPESNLLTIIASELTHVCVGFTRREGSGVFYAHPSYLRNHWYLDPAGVYWRSSIGAEVFCPSDIDQKHAVWFFRKMRRELVGRNRSKLPQPERQSTNLSPAKAAVFMQDYDEIKSDQSCHLTRTEMLGAAAASGHAIYVKPHPNQSPAHLADIQRFCSRHANLQLTDANVHDLVGVSEMVICQNSAVGFEALLQRKPVLTCAKSDYHHAVLEARTPQELQTNMDRAAEHARSFPFAKYVYWFARLHLLDPRTEGFANRAWNKLQNT